MHVGRKRLAKIDQILLVKIAKLGGGKWGNEFGGDLARVAISEEGGRCVVVGGDFGWKYPRLSLTHKLVCAGDNPLYRWRIITNLPGVTFIAGA
jgi:hypothetical protein